MKDSAHSLIRILSSTRVAAMAVLLAVGLTACQSTPIEPEPTPSTPAASTDTDGRTDSPDSAQLAYELSRRQWCSNNDALSLVLMMTEGQDNCTTFQKRCDTLAEHGLIDLGWQLDADKPVTRGTLAYMLYHALDMNGGVMVTLFPSRRYAYREAVYQGIMSRGAEYEPLTGPEVVGIIGRAERQKHQ